MICGKGEQDILLEFPRKKKAFVLDHCHETGRFRGYLCDRCNVGLGKFRDSPDLLGKAMLYLLRHKKSSPA